MYKARRESQHISTEVKEEARDPDPDVEARQDIWSIKEDHINIRNHVAPRTKLFAPKDDFPIPLSHMDALRHTKTCVDVLLEATNDDYWNSDGDKSLSQPCIGVTRFALLNKNPPEGHMWVQGRLTKKQVTARPGHMWPEEWSNMSKRSQRKAINKWAEEKPNLDEAREQRHTCSIPDDPDFDEIMNSARRKFGDEKSLSDALQSHQISQPERCNLGATSCD